MTWTQTHCLKNEKKQQKTMKKNVLLEFVREIEELKEGQSESDWEKPYKVFR